MLGIDLDVIGNTRSWAWFARRVRVLLTTPNPLTARFAPSPPSVQEPEW